ncbi:hypothetical protein V1511DRAFT_501603 [Dipodascopsis uninucleata]
MAAESPELVNKLSSEPSVSETPKISRKKKSFKSENGLASNESSNLPAEISVGSINGDESGSGKFEFESVIQKRIRNLQKRKQKLDKYEEQAATPDAAKLNADQLAALKVKDQVIYPLKELEELLKVYKTAAEDQAKERAKEEAKMAKDYQEAITTARDEAINAAKDTIRVLVKFLHVASWKRQIPSEEGSKLENAAFESLLNLIYGGDDNSVDAVEKLGSGSEDIITIESGNTTEGLSFKTVKELSLKGAEELYAKAQEVESQGSRAYSESVEKLDIAEELDDLEPLNTVIRIPKGGIQFLNESELDLEEIGAPVPSAPPPQTLVTEFPQLNETAPPIQTYTSELSTIAVGDTERTEDHFDNVYTESTLSNITQPVTAEPVWEQNETPVTVEVKLTEVNTNAGSPVANSNKANNRSRNQRQRNGKGNFNINNSSNSINNSNNNSNSNSYNHSVNNENGERRNNGRGYYRNRSRGSQQQQPRRQQTQSVA